MAVTNHKRISTALALATSSLLGQSAVAQPYANDWQINAGFLNYQEKGRVSVQSYTARVQGQVSDDASVQLGVVLDTMSGSTPTGAVKDSTVVSNTGTSGGGFNVAGQGTSMADFEDTRLAVDGSWEQSHSREFRMTYGAYVSVEKDFTAIGASVKGSLDVNDRLTTLTAGLGVEADENSQRDGTTPEPLSSVGDASFNRQGRRNTYDALLGITQVIDRRTVAQLNLTYTHSFGYHTDPYKVFSATDSDGIEFARYYEKRPEQRQRLALFSSLRQQQLDGNILGGSLRLYHDDWGVNALTSEASYRFNTAGQRRFTEPFGRVHMQTAADFYLRSLQMGEPLPRYASADNRLAQMQSYTLGVNVGIPVARWGLLQGRASYFYQVFQDATYDRNRALILSLNYAFGQRN